MNVVRCKKFYRCLNFIDLFDPERVIFRNNFESKGWDCPFSTVLCANLWSCYDLVLFRETNITSDLQQAVAPHCSVCQPMTDENVVLWNIEQGCCQGLEVLEHETITVQRRKTASVSFGTPTYTIKKSNVKFESVNQDATYLDNGNSAKEIIGPKESIKGHPLIVINNLHSINGAGQDNAYIDVSHMTLLYRRFQTGPSDATSESPPLHSLQWLPIYVGSYLRYVFSIYFLMS